ncbi:15700_t:CDS:2 [Cetraspora pellucida]|uniref:15700_t:CDS:1 n=1 Tax=Cetraspora pellucida TaxID=1433469 RepID=A0A9N9GDR0_9GLOM|nr:15700_t:CDS:2 [Cetraspora pellucida]
MSFTNTPKNSNFNVNTLKLTPEKLAEWSKRRASNTHNNEPSQQSSNDFPSQPPTNCASDPQEIDACKDLRGISIEKIQESQLYMSQDLDYLEKSLESFEDELAVARVSICELKQDTARQITINIFEQIEEMTGIFKIDIDMQ